MEKVKTFYEGNKNTTHGVGGLVIIVLIVLGGYFFFSGGNSGTVGDIKEGESSNVTPTPVNYSATKGATGNMTAKIAYGDALTKYKSTLIQFGEKCDTLAFKHVYKNGTEIMIDNRAGEAKMFRVGDNAVSIGAYDYAIVKLEAFTFPKTIAIDCGAKQNVSEVVIQQ